MSSIPQRLLGEALIRSAERNPNKVAIITRDKEYSFNHFRMQAEQLAGYLIHRGIKRGDRVAVYMNNSWECVVSIYGITLAGGVFLIINPQTKADKFRYILNDSGAKILISEKWGRNEFIPALEDTKNIQEVIISDHSEDFHQNRNYQVTLFDKAVLGNLPVTLPRIIPNDLAALIYTSGSTGFPKGVMMTHQSMVFASWSLIEYLRLDENDRIMLILPLAFDYGLYQLLMAVNLGGTLILEESFAFPASIYKQIEKSKPTIFPGVPTIYAMMIATHKNKGLSFECIQKITNTAAALPAEFIPDLRKIFPNALIFKMYGLTECKRVCYLEPELVDKKPDSVGKAIPGTEAYLLTPEGKPANPGERGILYVRGPHVMLGYWNKPEQSKEMLRDGILPYERILCTNDWFTIDSDGDLYFLGRSDDIIKTRGEKVSPVEIECIIYKIPGIKEVAVMGIPDEILGESIIAYVTLHKDVQMDVKSIQKACMAGMEMFMVPKQFVILEEMPKSANGKINRKFLKENHKANG